MSVKLLNIFFYFFTLMVRKAGRMVKSAPCKATGEKLTRLSVPTGLGKLALAFPLRHRM